MSNAENPKRHILILWSVPWHEKGEPWPRRPILDSQAHQYSSARWLARVCWSMVMSSSPGSIRIDPGALDIFLDQTPKVWPMRMTTMTACRAVPARKIKALEKASSLYFIESLNTGMSATGTVSVLLWQKMARSTMRTVRFLRNVYSICLGGINIFSGLDQLPYKTGCSSKCTERF